MNQRKDEPMILMESGLFVVIGLNTVLVLGVLVLRLWAT